MRKFKHGGREETRAVHVAVLLTALLFFMETTEMQGNTFEYHNENRDGKNVGDCTVRSISVALNQDWDTTYWGLCMEGWMEADMPSGNNVWGKYLRRKGWKRYLPEYDDMTVQEFAYSHPYGTYLLSLDSHIVCVLDGNIVDTWNSGKKTVLYYWMKG